MPIANGRTSPRCRDGANFVRLGHCGAGHPELLSARFPPRPFEPCDALGRSQVVRQRILIPPSGGSNPPAPATHSRNAETSPHPVQSPVFCGPLRARRLETAWNGSPDAQLAGRSLTSNFQSPEFARVLCRYRFALAQVGSYLLLRPAGVRNHAGRTVRAPLLRRHLLVQANPSCFSWSAQTVGRLRTSRVTA